MAVVDCEFHITSHLCWASGGATNSLPHVLYMGVSYSQQPINTTATTTTTTTNLDVQNDAATRAEKVDSTEARGSVCRDKSQHDNNCNLPVLLAQHVIS